MFLLLSFVITLLASPELLPPPLLQPKVRTPITETELVVVLQEAHVEVFERRASRARLAAAWGQIALENGRGKAVFNHNLGNIGSYSGYPYYKHGRSRFRAFAGFHEAAVVYWELLRDRCSAALASFDAMNGAYTAMKLRRCGYHRTDVGHYGRALHSLTWEGYRLVLKSGPVGPRLTADR